MDQYCYQIFLFRQFRFKSLLLTDQVLYAFVLPVQIVNKPCLLLLQHCHLRLKTVQVAVQLVVSKTECVTLVNAFYGLPYIVIVSTEA